jgi:ketosteroid isomerase-like protein
MIEMSHLKTTKTYLRTIEERGDTLAFFTDDVVQKEFPNRLLPNGATRDMAALKRARARGIRVVSDERYEIVKALEQGDDVALEVVWTAKLEVPVGETPAGGTMRAHFGVFLTFRDGKIASQRNYDCFDPF